MDVWSFELGKRLRWDLVERPCSVRRREGVGTGVDSFLTCVRLGVRTFRTGGASLPTGAGVEVPRVFNVPVKT